MNSSALCSRPSAPLPLPRTARSTVTPSITRAGHSGASGAPLYPGALSSSNRPSVDPRIVIRGKGLRVRLFRNPSPARALPPPPCFLVNKELLTCYYRVLRFSFGDCMMCLSVRYIYIYMVSHTTRLVCYAIPLCPGPSHPDTKVRYTGDDDSPLKT